MRPKVGHIKFLNCFPIYYGLVGNMDILDMELIPGSPTELNNLMIEGKLDISPMSSIEYYRHADEFLLCPYLSVSSNGHVGSILLTSKVPVKELDHKTIALTSQSATSHILLKIILEKKYKLKPEYFASSFDLDKMLNDASAGLLIGDKALEESLKNDGLYHYDLGEEWKELTGKKMVYAVWCIRKKFAVENLDLTKKMMDAFKNAYDYSKENLSEIITRASTWKKFSHPFIDKYLRELDFSFGEDAREGLKTFFDLAVDMGLVETKKKMEFYPHTKSDVGERLTT